MNVSCVVEAGKILAVDNDLTDLKLMWVVEGSLWDGFGA